MLNEIKNKDYLFKDFPEKLEITEATRKSTKSNPKDLSYRQSKGLFYTDAKKEKYIQESLKRDLPGKDNIPIKRRILK